MMGTDAFLLCLAFLAAVVIVVLLAKARWG